MKILQDYSRAMELLPIPIVATMCFGAYLIYSSWVMSDGNSLFKDIRDSDFPILEMADKNINRYEAIVLALNTASTTGEEEFINIAKDRASEILGSYETLEKLDAEHKSEIEKLKFNFNTYFSLALGISQQMAATSAMPSLPQISKMRSARDAYLSGLVAYRDAAEKDFHGMVNEAIRKSERAQVLGMVIGMIMLTVIMMLTLRVRRVTYKRKQAEDDLLRSEANLRAMLDNSPYMTWLKDTEGRYITINKVFAGHLRLNDIKQAIGKTDFDLKSDELAEKTRAEDIEVMAARQQRRIEESVIDGKNIYWMEIFKTPIIDAHGNMLGTVGFSNDITERKKTEQELIVWNNYLTHEVSKRTSDLSALTAHIQKIAEAERANIARELHDELGSTLTGIKMGLGQLSLKVSAPDVLQDLSSINDLASNASQIARGIINQLYPTVLDDYGFAAAVDLLVKKYRKHSGIAVELVFSEEQILMDHIYALAAYRITQECLTNVAKHAEASKVRVEVKVSDGFLDLTIHDDGKGLSGGVNTGGHGIFGMIERARYLGGSMEIGSEEGKGTTARLSLPLAVSKPKNKKRVLVVDDHAIVRNAIRQLLVDQTDDFSVEGEAVDGQAGIQMATEGVWDIMLLDITLPKKNGMKVLEEIKALKPSLPIIMLSSHTIEEYGEVALLKGAACYIEKGETSKLVEAMRRATLSPISCSG
jgi:two-component system sensor histidine kinase UhpB